MTWFPVIELSSISKSKTMITKAKLRRRCWCSHQQTENYKSKSYANFCNFLFNTITSLKTSKSPNITKLENSMTLLMAEIWKVKHTGHIPSWKFTIEHKAQKPPSHCQPLFLCKNCFVQLQPYFQNNIIHFA